MTEELLDVFVRVIPLPRGSKGAVVPNEDATYDIYINANLCLTEQRKALAHELRHIKNDHLYDGRPIGAIEEEAGN